MKTTPLQLLVVVLAAVTLVGTTGCGSTMYGVGLDWQHIRSKASNATQPRYQGPSYQRSYVPAPSYAPAPPPQNR